MVRAECVGAAQKNEAACEGTHVNAEFTSVTVPQAETRIRLTGAQNSECSHIIAKLRVFPYNCFGVLRVIMVQTPQGLAF
jgi:hypothetical protein